MNAGNGLGGVVEGNAANCGRWGLVGTGVRCGGGDEEEDDGIGGGVDAPPAVLNIGVKYGGSYSMINGFGVCTFC